MSNTLTTRAEKESLVALEKVIERGKKSFVEVGAALAEIRDSKLYRQGFKTFAEYCDKRWGWKANYCHKLIEAADTVAKLPPEKCTIVHNESQARALAAVPEPERAAVLEKAAESGPVTAASIKAAAVEVMEPEPEPEDTTHIQTADEEIGEWTSEEDNHFALIRSMRKQHTPMWCKEAASILLA